MGGQSQNGDVNSNGGTGPETKHATRNRNRAIWNFRIALGVIFGLTAGSILFLQWRAFTPVEIAADLAVDEFSMTLSRQWKPNPMRAKTIAISNAESLSLEHSGVERGRFGTGADAITQWVKISAATPLRIGPLENFWSVSIESEYIIVNLTIAQESTIRFTTSGQNQNRVRLSISGGVAGSVDVAERILLACNLCRARSGPAEVFELGGDAIRVKVKNKEIAFRSSAGDMTIDLELIKGQNESKPYQLGSNINVADLDFTRLEGDSRKTTIVKDGAISLPELGEKKLEVKAFDFVELEKLSEFQIRQLSLDDYLGLALRGKVGSMQTGTAYVMRSRLPSYLSWLYENQFLRLFLASLIPVFSTILAIFYRLRLIGDDKT